MNDTGNFWLKDMKNPGLHQKVSIGSFPSVVHKLILHLFTIQWYYRREKENVGLKVHSFPLVKQGVRLSYWWILQSFMFCVFHSFEGNATCQASL